MVGDAPWVASSREELLAGAQSRLEVDRPDGKSGSVFELVTIDGAPYFAKTLGYRTDWIMRITGDRDLRTLKIWRAGIMGESPPEIDHAVVGMAADGEGEAALLTILMRDIGECLFEEGDSTIELDAHLGLLDGLAALSERWWGWRDDFGLTTMAGTSAVLRARQHRRRNHGGRSARADPRRIRRLAAAGRAGAGPLRIVGRDPRVARRARGGDGVDAGHVPARRLEAGQSRAPRRRPNGPARLGLSGIGSGALGSRVVPRARTRRGSRSTKRLRSPRFETRSPGEALRPRAGSISSWTCASSRSRRASAGRRRWGARKSCGGGSGADFTAPAMWPTRTQSRVGDGRSLPRRGRGPGRWCDACLRR